MSEHHPQDEHSSFIKTPKQLIAVVVLAFVVPIGLISMLASLAASSVPPGAVAYSESELAKRLKPVGEVVVAAGGGAGVVRTGQQVTEAVCAACHATGALNAPKIGDSAAWAPLIKEGLEHLTQTAIKGVRQMPPRGGNPDLSDVEVARAVAFMANQSGAKFQEPAAPAAPVQVAAAPGAPPAGAPAGATTAASPAALGTAVAAAGTGSAAAASAAKGGGAAADGKAVYQASCFACHGTGAAGAPKLGDKAAWAPRLKQGVPALYESSIKGKGAMPPKGGAAALADADVKAAVDFMVSQSK